MICYGECGSLNWVSNNYCIILSFQHAVLDGWSVASLMSELFEDFRQIG